MRVNNKIYHDEIFWTKSRVRIWQTSWIILFLIFYPFVAYKAYEQFKADNVEQSVTVEGMIVRHYLTMQSAINIEMADGLIINATLGEVIEYSIQEHWTNTMLEEENRIPD